MTEQVSPRQYWTVHYWIKRQLGKPNICVSCDKTEGRFDWANISGEYKHDISDWQRMCRACHSKMDKKSDRCPKGHELVGHNVFIRKRKNGVEHRECRACKNARLVLYRKRRLERLLREAGKDE